MQRLADALAASAGHHGSSSSHPPQAARSVPTTLHAGSAVGLTGGPVDITSDYREDSSSGIVSDGRRRQVPLWSCSAVDTRLHHRADAVRWPCFHFFLNPSGLYTPLHGHTHSPIITSHSTHVVLHLCSSVNHPNHCPCHSQSQQLQDHRYRIRTRQASQLTRSRANLQHLVCSCNMVRGWISSPQDGLIAVV